MRLSKRPAIVLALAALTCAAPHSALAFFTNQKPATPISTKITFKGFKQNVVNQIGAGSANARPSHGNAIPLDVALRMLAPAGWRLDNKAPGSQKVSWRAGGKTTWTQALSRIGRRYGLRFLIDWPHKTLYALPAVTSAGGHKTAKTISTWTIDPGRSIRANLADWGAQAGWKVLWTGETWMPVASAVFTGTFFHAVRKLLGALRAQGADIHAEAFGNQVLVVHTVSGVSQ